MNQHDKLREAILGYTQAQEAVRQAIKTHTQAVAHQNDRRKELIRVIQAAGMENKTIIFKSRAYVAGGNEVNETEFNGIIL